MINQFIIHQIDIYEIIKCQKWMRPIKMDKTSMFQREGLGVKNSQMRLSCRSKMKKQPFYKMTPLKIIRKCQFSLSIIQMKVWGLSLLLGTAMCQSWFRQEVQTAFLQFDMDRNQVVTRDEMIQAIMKDVEREKYSEQQRLEMISVIDLMTTTHDLDNNGLDFLELYVASGGKPQDL